MNITDDDMKRAQREYAEIRREVDAEMERNRLRRAVSAPAVYDDRAACKFYLMLAVIIGCILAAMMMAGCKANLKNQSRTEATAIHASTAAVNAHADAIKVAAGTVNGDAEDVRKLVRDALAIPAVPPFVVTALHGIDAKAVHIQQTAAAQVKEADGVKGETAKVDDSADKQVQITDKAVDDKNSVMHGRLVWLVICGLVVMAFSVFVLWWTEKFRIAGAVLSLGVGLLAAGWFGLWAMDHPFEIFVAAMFSVVGGACAYDIIKHPNDGWEHWLWSSLAKKSPTPASPAQTPKL